MQLHNTLSHYLFLNINLFYSVAIYDINEDYPLKIGEVITICNGIIYYETPCVCMPYTLLSK